MNGIIRAGLAGALGAFAGAKVGPKVMEYLKPESDFAKQAVSLGVAGGATAASWYVLGLIVPGLK